MPSLYYLARDLLFIFAVVGSLIGWLFASPEPAAAVTINRRSLDVLSIYLGQSGYTSPLTALFSYAQVDKVSPVVRSDLSAGKKVSVVILLKEQADLSLAHQMVDPDERGWFVYNALTRHAEQTQSAIKDLLRQRDAEYRTFWAANMIVADIDESVVNELAARSDVARIDPNRPQRWIEPVEDIKSPTEPKSRLSPQTVEWGITNVNAPAVWSMGHTGQGIVIGGLDTGIRWSHDTLISKYRGWNGTTADHNYNWLDAIHTGGGVCGANAAVPCDDSGHGTHTVGTMVGDDNAGNQIGVAPGAKWIGCRNMNQGTGTPATYAECFQFMIAPTDLAGNNPDPTRRPHIINNSWACPPGEGCTTGAELETIVNSAVASGIFVVASAGNSGPGCSTVAWPPATYSSAFAVGSINSSNQLANGSSRGPSLYYNPNLAKPNISAPGVGVRSSTSASNTSFSTLNGTSMAGPHVAGTIALLWSAIPSLQRDIPTTTSILEATANPDVTLVTPQTCGGIPSSQIPNNSFGYGRVDALTAVLFAQSPTMGIAGRAISPSGLGVRNALVTLIRSDGTVRTATANTLGYFQFDDVSTIGTYSVTISSKRYRFESRTVSAGNGNLTNLEFVGLE